MKKTLDCLKCLKNCKAVCCGVIPFDKEFFDNHNPVRKVKELMDFEDHVIAITENKYCPFLGEDYICSIYEDRPEVCRLFGNEESPCLVCPYQDKNGHIRSRQERRSMERKSDKLFEKFNKINGNQTKT